MKTFAIIPAGGKGLRSGAAAPKQYLKFKGKELIVYTLETFQKNKLVNEIIVAAHPSYFPVLERLKKKYKLTKLKQIVAGGKERQDSVYNALQSIKAEKKDLVIVHDAARPLLPQQVLTNAIKTAEKKGNALVCVKAGDTIIKGNDTVHSYIDRNQIYYVQTPQIFTFGVLQNAMEKAQKEHFDGTDESMLVKRLKKKIYISEGSLLNFKVTTNSDIELLKKLI